MAITVPITANRIAYSAAEAPSVSRQKRAKNLPVFLMIYPLQFPMRSSVTSIRVFSYAYTRHAWS